MVRSLGGMSGISRHERYAHAIIGTSVVHDVFSTVRVMNVVVFVHDGVADLGLTKVLEAFARPTLYGPSWNIPPSPRVRPS